MEISTKVESLVGAVGGADRGFTLQVVKAVRRRVILSQKKLEKRVAAFEIDGRVAGCFLCRSVEMEDHKDLELEQEAVRDLKYSD